MSTTLTRRAVLQIAGGSVLGLLFSPIPWKLLDDTSIWTQNWPWIPKGAAGPISYMGATCTMCQSACGMRARVVGKQPIGLAGIAKHPFNDGALCTMGLLAHHLCYHPARVKRALKFAPSSEQGTPVSSTIVLDEISRCMKGANAAGTVGIVDSRPGRTASSLFALLAAANPAMRYIPAAPAPLDVLYAMTSTSAAALGPVGCDIDASALILNFGAPLFDNWGTPSRASTLLDKRASKAQTIIHIEGIGSRSAERSTQWIAARPGSETLLALGIANVMLAEKLYSPAAARSISDFKEFAGFVATFTPEAVSKAAGVTPETIRTTARAFASSTSSVAIIGSEASFDAQGAVMALNILAGAIGRTGGVSLRQDVPNAAAMQPRAQRSVSIHDVPDHSLRAVILDESLSGCIVSDAVLQKKLVKNDAIIISLSPFTTPRPFCTQYVLPSTVAFETVTDVPGPIDRAGASLALSTAVLKAPADTMDAVQFALAAAQAAGTPLAVSGTSEEIVKQRIAALHASKRGSVFAPSTGATMMTKDVASADDVWTALAEGGCWMDDAAKRSSSAVSFAFMNIFNASTVALPKPREIGQLVVLPFAEMKIYDTTAVSPLMKKLSQESSLRLGLHQAYVNPATAAGASVVDGEAISLTTEHGTMNVQAKLDAAVMPDVIFVSTAAAGEAGRKAQQPRDIRMLCDMNGNGSCSPTPVSIKKVMA